MIYCDMKFDLKLMLLAELFINYNCQLLKIFRKTTDKPASSSGPRISALVKCLVALILLNEYSILRGTDQASVQIFP